MKNQGINFPSEINLVSTILIVNQWKLVLSGVNAKKKEKRRGEKKRNSVFPFLFDSSVLCSIKNSSKIKMLVCSECIQLFQMSNI